MKGIVFTEFLELVGGKFGQDVCDDLLDNCELASGGSYTAVGNYDWKELVTLVSRLSAKTGVVVPDLIRAFGEHLFGRFVELYPVFFEGINNPLEFLSSVETIVHVEVLKLYPDAELPRFEYSNKSDSGMQMVYTSARPFGDLAEGLIIACLRKFGDSFELDREDLVVETGAKVRFTLSRAPVLS